MLAGFAWLRVAGCSRFGWVVWGGLRTYTALATADLPALPRGRIHRRKGGRAGPSAEKKKARAESGL